MWTQPQSKATQRAINPRVNGRRSAQQLLVGWSPQGSLRAGSVRGASGGVARGSLAAASLASPRSAGSLVPAAAGSAGRRPRRCPEPSCRSRVLLVAPSELESVGGMQRHEIRSVLTLPLPRGCHGGDSAMRAVWRRLCDGAELSGMAEVEASSDAVSAMAQR
mgnify:CR=1 FL=1